MQCLAISANIFSLAGHHLFRQQDKSHDEDGRQVMAVAEDLKERFDKKRFWRRPPMRLCRVTKSKWKRQLVKSNRAALREDSVPAALFTDCLTCLPSSLWSPTLAIKSPPRKHEKFHLLLGLAFPISCDAPGHSSSPTFEGLLERPVLV